jgi:hypothetical protein
MRDTTQKPTAQRYTVFGGAYVQERHGDELDRNLPPSEIAKLIGSLNAAMFYELMKTLRSALDLRRKGKGASPGEKK